MLLARGITLLALLAVVAGIGGCGTGNRLDVLDGDPYTGGFFLPPVHTMDIRLQNELILGVYDGGTDQFDLTYPADTSQTSGAAFTIPHNTTITSDEQVYDLDGDGIIEYIVLTIRALSAQAQANTTVLTFDEFGNPVYSDPGDFYKVGGAAFEPGNTVFMPSVTIFLPLDGAASALPGETLPVYRFVPAYADNRAVTDDIGTGSGGWQMVGNGTVESGGSTVSIAVQSFGQYAVVSDSIVHNQGDGTDV